MTRDSDKDQSLDTPAGATDNQADNDTPEDAMEPEESHNRIYSRRTPSAHDTEQGTQIWLISFTDVMALMLTFFVLLFSMAVPEQKNWEEMTSALNNEFNRYYGAALNRGPVEDISLNKIDFDDALSLDYLKALLVDIINSHENLSETTVVMSPRHLVLSMPQSLLFESGSADIRQSGARSLYTLGGALSRIKNKIEIIGHTDPEPVSASASVYNSNWDLSLARAAEIAGVLNNVGYERQISIRGHGSGLYKDLQDIKDEQTRLDIARRVDILIYSHDGRKKDLLFAPVIR